MAATDNLPDIDQNSAYKHEFAWFSIDENTRSQTPIDITGYAAKIDLRKKAGDPVAFASWSTSNGKITVTGNSVKIFVPASVTATYSFTEAEYDLLIWHPSNVEDVTRLVKGTVKLDKGVTVR